MFLLEIGCILGGRGWWNALGGPGGKFKESLRSSGMSAYQIFYERRLVEAHNAKGLKVISVVIFYTLLSSTLCEFLLRSCDRHALCYAALRQ